MGHLIRDARTRSGLSQRTLARRAGTTQAEISRIERGREQPTIERVSRILASLGWQLELSTTPLSEHDAEPARVVADARSEVADRLERGLAWMALSRDLAGAARD